jgi:gliding motility-associated-like protein
MCKLIKPVTIICVLLSVITSAQAQKQANNWFFGEKAGISFASGQPVNSNGGQVDQYEGVACISDENGFLLFYTDGITVWNKQHTVMQNGTGLNGHPSTSQSAIIVPQPANDSIYYIFTCDYQGYPKGLCYSIVNIKKQNGLGEVIQKNSFLLQPVTEKLTAVAHCNNRDVWVITRAWNSFSYYAWLISPSGILTTPVVSVTPNYVSGNDQGTIGYMKASPDGKKIAATFSAPLSFTEISNFNNQTGVITNTIKLPALAPGIFSPVPSEQNFLHYGVEFSPDSKLLYLSSRDILEWLSPPRVYEVFSIYQFNTSIHDSLQIMQSRKIIDSSSSVIYRHAALQTGPDNKIYVAEEGSNFLSSIQSPNNIGASSNFQRQSVPLSNRSWLGLPPFIQSYFGNNTYNYSFNNNCSSQNVSFQINNTQGYSSIKWDFGDIPSGSNNTSAIPNPTHNFTAAGIYEVKLIVNRNNNPCAIPDTIKKSIWVGNVSTFLGIDTTICEKDTITLQVNAPGGVSYLWSNNTTGNSIRVTNPGNYSVTVYAGACTYTDDINIVQQLLPRFTLGNDAAICSNASITLQPTPAIPNGTYLWNTNAVTGTITVNTPGMYWLRRKDNLGCTWRDTIQVAAKQLPNFNLGKDTAICEQQTVTFNTQILNASYLWNTGATSQSITASAAGIYWADVTKDGCKYRDSIELAVNPLPVVNLGKDSTLCEGQTLLLNAVNAGASYVWQDNSVQPNFTVTSAGNYHVRVTRNGCITKDTIKVDYTLKPRFTLGADKIICPGETVVLQPNANNLSGVMYLWQNGTTLQSFSTNQAGLYFLSVTNNCGTTTDSIILKDGTCKIYVPNAFTPDGNNLNDVFKVLNTEAITEFEFIIFNRWGQIVFQTTDKQKGWDGRMNSTALPAGTYPWTLKYKETGSNDTRFLKGQVLLIR